MGANEKSKRGAQKYGHKLRQEDRSKRLRVREKKRGRKKG